MLIKKKLSWFIRPKNISGDRVLKVTSNKTWIRRK